MRAITRVCAIVCILFAAHPAAGGDVTAADFSLVVKAPEASSTRRSLPLDLKVTYKGKGPTEVSSLRGKLHDISFDAPEEWISRTQSFRHTLIGRFPGVTLEKGSCMSRTIDLQDYFSKITPGKATLSVILPIWPEGGKADQPVVLKDRVTLNLEKESDEELKRYVKKTANRIAEEEDVDKREKLYRDIMAVSLPDVVPVLTKGLTDLRVQPHVHDLMRQKIFELAESHGGRDIVVRYLAENGARRDRYFFNKWQDKKVSLSGRALELLCNARNPWIRLYALKMSPEGPKRRRRIGSLETIIADMSGELESLKKAKNE